MTRNFEHKHGGGDDESEKPFDNKDIVLRTFEQGGGAYDHVVVALPDGSFRAFIPPPELKQDLIEQGVPVVPEKNVDEATIELHVKSLREEMREDTDITG